MNEALNNPFARPHPPTRLLNLDCPFKVGDRVHELRCLPVYGTLEETMKKVPQFELDTTKPDATVTEITPLGFKYRYDYSIPIGRAQWGMTTEGGECYIDGYYFWRKI